MLAKTRKHPTGLGNAQKGAEIVEFLVTLPTVLLLFAVIFDFGIAFSDQSVLTQAARAAAREVVMGATDAEAQQAADQITPAILSREASAALPSVSVVRSGTDPGDPITVTISHNFGFFLLPGFIAGLMNINLSASTVMHMLPN